MAIPAEEHLFGLKSAIYKNPYKNEVADTALSGFTLIGKDELRYELKLDSRESIKSLFMMTPYAYRTKKEDKEKILASESLMTEVHFLVLTYRKD